MVSVLILAYILKVVLIFVLCLCASWRCALDFLFWSRWCSLDDCYYLPQPDSVRLLVVPDWIGIGTFPKTTLASMYRYFDDITVWHLPILVLNQLWLPWTILWSLLMVFCYWKRLQLVFRSFLTMVPSHRWKFLDPSIVTNLQWAPWDVSMRFCCFTSFRKWK